VSDRTSASASASASAGLTRWRYQAADAQGAMTRGEVDAVSAEAAVDLLRRRSLWVIDLEPARGASVLVSVS
jgi:type II secretory pathway component PulF